MTIIRMDPDDRRAQLLSAALKLATKVGWRKVTRGAVAGLTGTSEALINRYFPRVEENGTVVRTSIEVFRDAVMAEAVARNMVPLIAEGVLYRNPVALKASRALKREAKDYIEQHEMVLPRWRAVADDGSVVHRWA